MTRRQASPVSRSSAAVRPGARRSRPSRSVASRGSRRARPRRRVGPSISANARVERVVARVVGQRRVCEAHARRQPRPTRPRRSAVAAELRDVGLHLVAIGLVAHRTTARRRRSSGRRAERPEPPGGTSPAAASARARSPVAPKITIVAARRRAAARAHAGGRRPARRAVRRARAASRRRSRGPPARRLAVPAELCAHRRQQLVGERVIAARPEPREQRRREHVHGHRLLDGGLDRPPPFAGVLHRPREPVEVRAVPSAPRAVRSSSHDPTTLPWRQTSATSARSKSYVTPCGKRRAIRHSATGRIPRRTPA